MADDRGVVVFLRQLDGIERLGERADLVHFHQNGVGHALIDRLAQEIHIRD